MVAHLGASDSYEACGYILLLFLAVGINPFWLRLSVGRSDSRKRHRSDPWGPNLREASALLGAVSLDTKILGISCLRF